MNLLHCTGRKIEDSCTIRHVRQLLTKHLLWYLRDSDLNGGGGDGSGM